ncbi:MFS transporter [Nocardiopsis composta]|uniref:Putative MFS family arabinose efflux permease n=1 Tax=Nocardiopsis composta TaxID=157465 RepID=A0A7W8QIS0_9ACTN|nr:MFS transporter [Nocardiopsis composta]MBB5431252.1 putative MFS family arabinose efflux permease [Nocardiopsis composta]
MPIWLFVLLAAGFVLYTDDYVIAGILPELAQELGVTEAQAGQLITVFSLTVALAAPVAAVAFARVPRRWLFTGALLVFIAANLAAAFVPSFAVLMALRIIAAGAAASMTPAVFAFAAQHAPPDKVGRYIAVVSLGVTGSIAAGVPIGTWIGGQLGWRVTFAAMAVAGSAVLVAVLAALPRERDAAEPPGLGEQLRTLRRAPISLGLLANCALMTGSMMMLTYLAPFLADTTTAGVNERALAFSLSGLAGIVCIWLGGSASDRWGPDRALAFGIGTITLTMAGLWGLWLIRPAPLSLVIVVGTVWGGMAFWNSPAIQARLHALAGAVAPQALALNTSGTYLGVAAGGAIGGLALSSLGAGSLPLIAAGFGIGAFLLLTLAQRLTPSGADRVASGERG